MFLINGPLIVLLREWRNKKISAASVETTPVMRKRPENWYKLRLAEVTALFWLGQIVSLNHLFWMATILSPSVTFSTALETSGTSGEPFWKTYTAEVNESSTCCVSFFLT